MSTPDSSVDLRHTVDAAATPRHELAFRVLDLLLVEEVSGRARGELRDRLARLTAELDDCDRR